MKPQLLRSICVAVMVFTILSSDGTGASRSILSSPESNHGQKRFNRGQLAFQTARLAIASGKRTFHRARLTNNKSHHPLADQRQYNRMPLLITGIQQGLQSRRRWPSAASGSGFQNPWSGEPSPGVCS